MPDVARPEPPAMGSAAWLEETRGILTRGERARLVPRAWSVLIGGLLMRPRTFVWRRRPSTGRVELDWRTTPSTPYAKHAEEACRDLLRESSLIEHSYRSWAFGAALAERDRVDIDPELFFVASMLHDVGLARPIGGTCFTTTGARLARELGASSGRSEDEVTAVADAIAHHITPGLKRRESGELGFYLQAGTALDLGGLRSYHLPVDFVQEVVCGGWPLGGVKREAGERWRAESAMVRHGRAHLLERWTRFSLAARIAPTPPRPCAVVVARIGDDL